MMKKQPKNTQFNYFFVYEHEVDGKVKRGSIVLCFPDKGRFQHDHHRTSVEAHLVKTGKSNPVLVDFKELGEVEIVKPVSK